MSLQKENRILQSDLNFAIRFQAGQNLYRKRCHLHFAGCNDEGAAEAAGDELNCEKFTAVKVPSCLTARQYLEITEQGE